MILIKKVVIIGAGGWGRECAEIIKLMKQNGSNIDLLGFLDDNSAIHGKFFNGDKVLGGLNCLENYYMIHFVCGISNGKTKKEVVERALEYGYIPITIQHPEIYRFSGSEVGVGVGIQLGARLAINTKIGDHVAINFNASIGHNTILHDYVNVNPLAAISGNCEIREGTMIGTGSSIIQGIKIGKYCKIGAGAVVIKDVPDNVTVVGVPAQLVRTGKRIEDHHAYT